MLNENYTRYAMDVVQDTLFEHIGADILNVLNDKDNEIMMMKSELSKYKRREDVLVMLVRGERIKVKLLEEKLKLLNEKTSEMFDRNIVKEVEDIIDFERNGDENENSEYFEKVDDNENKDEESTGILLCNNGAIDNSDLGRYGNKIEESVKIEISEGEKNVQEKIYKKILYHQDESQNKPAKNESKLGMTEMKHMTNAFVESNDDNLTNEILDELFEHEDEKQRIFDKTELEEVCEFKQITEENIEIMEPMTIKRERSSGVIMDINDTLTDNKKIRAENMKTVGVKRKKSCEACRGCLAPNCSVCKYCLDKPKFGGSNRLKKKCLERQCEAIL